MAEPARYVFASHGEELAGAARQWAVDHSRISGAQLVTVRVAGEHAPVGPPQTADGSTIVLRGRVPEALSEFVRDDDVLVLGTDKTGFIHARVFGSTGIRIAAAVRCSVAVVPESDLRFRSAVVVGVDDAASADSIARIASAEAAERSEPLQLIHSFYDEPRSELPHTIEPMLERAAAAVKQRRPDLEVSMRSTARPPVEALLDASRNAALLVLGSHTGRPMLGSVAHDVLVNINAPVLLVRSHS